MYRGDLKECCNLTAEHLCRATVVEIVDSFIILTYIVAIDTRYKGSMSLYLEEDVGVDDRGTRALVRRLLGAFGKHRGFR